MVTNYEYKTINGEEISVDCLIKIIIGNSMNLVNLHDSQIEN